MKDYIKRIIGSYIAINDKTIFTLSHIPNGSIIIIRFPFSNNIDNTSFYFESFIISKYTDEHGANMISFASIDNPILKRVYTIDVNKENIWLHYNPENIDLDDINFGFDKKYLEIVAIYNRIENKKIVPNYSKYLRKLYYGKKYELKAIFLRKFKYEYNDTTWS